MIISKKIGGSITRIPFRSAKIRDLFRNVRGQNVSVLGFAPIVTLAKQMLYERYIVGSIPHKGLPPGDIFYIIFMMKKYGDLRISVTEDCQITLSYNTIYTKSGRRITVNKNFLRDGSESLRDGSECFPRIENYI